MSMTKRWLDELNETQTISPEEIEQIERDRWEQWQFENYQIEQEISQYDAEKARCEELKAQGIECDFCRPIVCTDDSSCICPNCLDLPF